jgi:signal transduction histidine kinase
MAALKSAYNAVMARARVFNVGNVLLNIASYLTVATIAIVGWFAVGPESRWVMLGLILAFVIGNLYYDTDFGRRHVDFYLAVQTVIVFALQQLGAEESLFNVLYFVLSAQAMVCLPPRRAAGWILVFCALTALMGIVAFGWIGLLYILPNFGGYAFFGTFGNLLRQAQEEKARSERLLEELRGAQSQLRELAMADERNRLAREMHDSLGHRLTVAVVQLEGAQRLIPSDPERAARMIGAMREQMKEALAELRRTVARLRTPASEELPLDAALRQLAESFQEGTGLQVHVRVSPDLPALSAAQRLALFRAAQEALTNAQRHARARNLWLDVAVNGREVALTAADDGQGFPASPSQDTAESLPEAGFGLRGLRERAAQLGGALRLGPRPGGGALLTFSLPLENGQAAPDR